MKKSILSLGKILNKAEQKGVLGGNTPTNPICECNSVGTIINQPCDGYGTGCAVIDIEPVSLCDVFPSLC